MKVLKDLLYTEDHEWIKVEGDRAYIGITDFAQHALGDIVYVELPGVGNEYSLGDAFSVVESVKAASDVYIPVDGRIVEVNEKLSDDPALLNQDPYENWMALVDVLDQAQIDKLMNASQYEEFCSREE
jgi:glycine cleavage system H protein